MTVNKSITSIYKVFQHVGVPKQVVEFVQYIALVSKHTVCHVYETCSLQGLRSFCDQTSLTARSFEMLANNLFRNTTARRYKPGCIEQPGISLSNHHLHCGLC